VEVGDGDFDAGFAQGFAERGAEATGTAGD
jgi:hypothetical protein